MWSRGLLGISPWCALSFHLHASTSTVSPLFVKGTHTTSRCKTPLKILFRQNILASRCSPTAMLHWHSDHCAESYIHLKGSARSQQKPFENKLLRYRWWAWRHLLLLDPCTQLLGFCLSDFVSSLWGIKYQLWWRREVWQVYYTDATPRTQRAIRQQGLLHRGAGGYSSSVARVGSMSCVEWVYKLSSLTLLSASA